MPAHVYAILVDGQAFGAQAGTLLGTRRAAGWQAETAASGEHAMPGQARIVWQLAQGAADPACGAAQAGQSRQLAIADHLAFGNLCQHQVERFAARLRTCWRLAA